jgi:transposase
MPRLIPTDVRLEAMSLYVAGSDTAKQITEKLAEKFEVDITISTIYSWAKKFNWDEKRLQIQETGVSTVMETESQRFARLQTEHLDTYTDIREKAQNELKGLNFHDAGVAARTVDMSIQGERKTMEGLIHVQFVQDILNVLVEEIADPETVSRIAARFQGVIQQAGDK